ncbi:MAG: hypothetical protein FJY97_14785, partial [candidate division Zixibacteria bacterium]|nr:hypothetical protein [candidate division Zixibacteria bacterium]
MDVPGHKEEFDRNGFTVLKGFFGADEVAAISARLDRYVAEIAPGLPAHDALYENKDNPETLFRFERMDYYDPFFKSLLLDERLMRLGGLLLDDTLEPRGVELFGKA